MSGDGLDLLTYAAASTPMKPTSMGHTHSHSASAFSYAYPAPQAYPSLTPYSYAAQTPLLNYAALPVTGSSNNTPPSGQSGGSATVGLDDYPLLRGRVKEEMDMPKSPLAEYGSKEASLLMG